MRKILLPLVTVALLVGSQNRHAWACRRRADSQLLYILPAV